MTKPKKGRRPKGRLPRGLHLTFDTSLGCYVWRAVDPTTGKRIRRSTGLTDIELASAKAKEFEDQLARRKAGLRDYSCWRIELEPLVKDWASDLRCNAARKRVSESALRRALEELKLKTAAELDDVGGLDRRLKALAGKGYRPSVLRRGFQDVLRRFSRWLAENRRHLDRDPLALWKPISAPAKGKVRPSRRALEPEEFARALLALERQERESSPRCLRIALTVLLVVGAREGALFERDVAHFDSHANRLDLGAGNDVKRRGAGALDPITSVELKTYVGKRTDGPLFLNLSGGRLAGLRFREAWRRAVSFGVVDRMWPADAPRDPNVANLVNESLLKGRLCVARGGPKKMGSEKQKARQDLTEKVASLTSRLRDTWAERMRGVDVHALRKTHRTWARARHVLGEAIDAQLGHAGHEDVATSAALRAAAGSRTGQRHYTDLALFDPTTSACAVRAVLDEAMTKLEEEGKSMLLPAQRMVQRMVQGA
ncbi:MAG: hypothetical protein KIT58_10165 [Planctomycetota bacterium]|nr:hypothetical protein [Planctomycetota bacterium]